MNEMSVKIQPSMLAVQSEHLYRLLQTASAQLHSGEDGEGIASLVSAISVLEKLVEDDQRSSQPQVDIGHLLPAMRTLYCYIKNMDIAGIADLLEDAFCPLTGQWQRGSDDL